MSFWLDDDENDNPWQRPKQIGNNGNAALTAQKSTQASQSDAQQLFHCINCGSNESYYDDATGTDVCTSCFTQSQTAVNSSQAAEADWEDVVGLAARTAGGQMIQQKFRNGTQHRGRTKQPLEELDRSVPLPDIAACLKGMQCVLQKCATIAVVKILPQSSHACSLVKSSIATEPDDDSDNSMDCERQRENISFILRNERTNNLRRAKLKSVLSTIKELWLSYLQAWAAGAEFYGSKYPHIRFSFRDHFLSNIHVSQIVRRYLPYQAKKLVQNASGTDLSATPDIPISGGNMDDHDDEDDESVTETTNDIGCTAIRNMIRKHNAHKRKGHMEAALHIRPSMTMVAALLWLALTKNREDLMDAVPITCVDICDWIATGKLPLLSAYQNLLSKSLQEQLQPIAAFFRLDHPIHPHQLEAMAINLCVACRMWKQPIVNDRHLMNGDETDAPVFPSKNAGPATVEPAVVVKPGNIEDVRFWSVSKLPFIIARLVARAGLHQGVLDRTLQLLGFAGVSQVPLNLEGKDSNPATLNVAGRIPMIVPAEHLSRMEEILALIAIACQLDPQWRTWTYCLPKREDPLFSPIIPWNESEFRMLTNGPSFRHYLDFMNENFFSKSDNTEKASLLPQEYFDAVKSIENMRKKDGSGETTRSKTPEDMNEVVRPCLVLAGANVPLEREMTEWTFQRPINGLAIYPQNRHQHRRNSPVSLPPSSQAPMTQSDHSRGLSTATVSNKRVIKRKRCNKEVDEMILLPYHDFQQADRAMSDWVPTHSTAAADLEELRLIHYLAYTFHIDPYRIQMAMQRLLEPPKK
jgi:hypothetical protein